MPDKIISIITDSMSLPRHKKDGDTPYVKTYPYMLKTRFGAEGYHFVEAGKRLRTILDALGEYDELVTLRKAEILILHVGLVDCAPRVFTPESRHFISKLPWYVRAPILKLIKIARPYFIEGKDLIQWVPPDKFRAACADLIARAKKDHLRSIIFIDILSPDDAVESRSPGFRKCVDEHNAILHALDSGDGFVHVVRMNPLINAHGGIGALSVDGMHLNDEGHRLLTEELAQLISQSAHKTSIKSVG